MNESDVDADIVRPVCPRHPQIETHLRCQRCERPTCPACQRSAAVGIHCVDCVREGHATIRTARTMVGGKLIAGRPWVTIGYIGLCVVLYLAQLGVPYFTEHWMLWGPVLHAEPWRIFTSAALHSVGFYGHIAFNMMALWIFGSVVEEYLGHLRYLVLCVLSALGAAVAMVWVAPTTPAVGASGVIFGIMGALVVLNVRLKRDNRDLLALLTVNTIIGFIPGLSIAWQAHVGGFIAGVAVATVLAFAPRQRRVAIQTLGIVGISLVLTVGLNIGLQAITPVDPAILYLSR